MKLLRELNEAKENRGQETTIIRAILNKHGVQLSKGHGQQYSDRRKSGYAFKFYVDEPVDRSKEGAIERDIKKALPGSVVTFFRPEKKVYDTRPWVRVRVEH